MMCGVDTEPSENPPVNADGFKLGQNLNKKNPLENI